MNTEPILDEAVLREITSAAGMAPMELVELFLDDMTSTMTQLDAARPARDAVLIGRLAHTLKSSAGNTGALAIASISRRLEALCKRGFDAEAEALCEALDQARDEFVALIAAERERLSAG
jgi:HPt (histidine-containing phosphotransfer) domain-containing protein